MGCGQGNSLEAVGRWAEIRHGVITRRQAMELGWSSSGWYRALDRGHLALVHPGVARLQGASRTRSQAVLAAVLAAGPHAVASHRSAASLWGIERPVSDPVDVLVPRDRTKIRLHGVHVHRPTDRVDLSPSVRGGIRCTNLLRTLVDLGAFDGDVRSAVSAAITSGVVTPAVLQYLLVRHARPGRHGVGALRRALDDWPLRGKPADSELEVRMAALLERYGLPAATFHARVAGFEVDFLVDGSNVVLECDGWDHHGRTREQFEWDRERDLVLGAAGFVVFHFTWRQVTRRPGWTARRLRELLDRWAPDLIRSLPNDRPPPGLPDVSAADLRGTREDSPPRRPGGAGSGRGGIGPGPGRGGLGRATDGR